MGWTDPDAHVYAVGEKVTAATLNTYVRENLKYLYNITHTLGTSKVPADLWTTTSSSFVDWNDDPCSGTFTKRGGTETQLRFDFNVTGFVTGGTSTLIQYGIRVGSTDYTNSFPFFVDDEAKHLHHGEILFVSGLAAGSYTYKLRVLVSTAARTLNINGNDFAQIAVTEFAV